MIYLEKLGFTPNDISAIKANNQELVVDRINKKERLISRNINYLKDLGVENYRDLFVNFSEFFLQDADVFAQIFSKYDKKDLVEKLKKNMAIIVRL